MRLVNSMTFKKYFVPGIVFQSVVIAGGYGTGKELVEFFMMYGTKGGLLSMLMISTLIWSIVCGVTFEFARIFRAYDYRSFFKKLLGRFWVLYEVLFYALMLMVLSVIASAAGSILNELLGVDYYVGVAGMMLGVGLLVLKGKETIEKILSYWSFLLYGVYIVFLIVAFLKFGDLIKDSLLYGNVLPGWVYGGCKYAFYNLGTIPALLFTTSYLETRKEAVTSGIIAGFIGIIPGVLLYIALIGQYPYVLHTTVPTNYLLSIVDSNLLQIIFHIILFVTLIETGTGYIYAFNERIAAVYAEKRRRMPKLITVALTLLLLLLGGGIARIGLGELISKGYGSITWGFFALYVVPILTIGIWKILKARKSPFQRI